MYLLISVTLGGKKTPELVSKTKKKLEEHLRVKGFYWSKREGRYIDDQTTMVYGGSGADYIISKVAEI